MYTMRGQTGKTPKHQHGAALVVSLILLLIMTIVGIAAMNGAQLEVRMAGMMQREEVALRAAERTLTAAERYVEDSIGNNFDAAVDGHYLPEDEPNVSDTDWTELASLNKSTVSELGDHDAFVVQYQGLYTAPGSALNDGGDHALPGEKANAYRIVTRSETAGNAVRIVESVYTKLYNPMAP